MFFKVEFVYHEMIFSPRNLSFGVVVCSNHQRSEENLKQFQDDEVM